MRVVVSCLAVLLLFIFGFCGSIWAAEAVRPVPPITNYRRGYRQRVEYIVAEIHKENLDTGSGPSDKARAYSKSMSPYKMDDAGHLIAARLGGTGKETYNIVPQNLSQNRGYWRTKVERPIYDAVKKKGAIVTYEVWPQYGNRRATRPTSLRYMAKMKSGKVVVSGTVPNPVPARLFDFESLDNSAEESDLFEVLLNSTHIMEQNKELNEMNDNTFVPFPEELNVLDE